MAPRWQKMSRGGSPWWGVGLQPCCSQTTKPLFLHASNTLMWPKTVKATQETADRSNMREAETYLLYAVLQGLWYWLNEEEMVMMAALNHREAWNEGNVTEEKVKLTQQVDWEAEDEGGTESGRNVLNEGVSWGDIDLVGGQQRGGGFPHWLPWSFFSAVPVQSVLQQLHVLACVLFQSLFCKKPKGNRALLHLLAFIGDVVS